MKKICYVFCHGFGLDVSFWAALKPYFHAEETFYCDLGYFGEVILPESIFPEQFDYVGVGHSLGLIKLLSLPIPWRSLIGLNGFVNFLGYNTPLREKRTREWRGLLTQLMRSPRVTLEQFYQRAGLSFSPDWAKLNKPRLLADLNVLAETQSSLQPILLLGAQDDVIVPPEVGLDNADACPHLHWIELAYGKHALGTVIPDMIYRSIKNWVITKA